MSYYVYVVLDYSLILFRIWILNKSLTLKFVMFNLIKDMLVILVFIVHITSKTMLYYVYVVFECYLILFFI